jgi:acetylornithine deacetylase
VNELDPLPPPHPQTTPTVAGVDPTAKEALAALVGFDTTSRGSNLDLISYVEELFDDHGVEHARVPNEDGTKANLVGHLGPDVPGGIVLSGHTDCVPVDGQPWETDPFTLTEHGGRFIGRGVTDMKSFSAVALSLLPAMAAAPLARPIQFAFTYDEELGTIGAPSAVDGLLSRFPRPAAAIVGEPTGMEVVTAHKGVRAFRVSVEGLDGHSSQPQHAANAIATLAKLMARIDELARHHREQAADPRFDPPYTTFNLATIEGGQALNIVPRHAELTFEFRPVPADDTTAIFDDLQRYANEVLLPELRSDTGVGEITFEVLATARALGAEPDGEAEALARALSGYEGPPRTVPFGTDGGHFQAAGISTAVIGPGWIEQAHQPNEWIDIEQLGRCETFLRGLIDHLST